MKLFISYGHEPPAIAAFAHQLVRDLRDAGHDPWIDSERIHARPDWRRALIDALHDSDWTVGLLSRHALRPGGVTRQELALADDHKGGCLTTILVEPLDGWEVPPTIARGQWIDMSDWQARQAADPAAYASWYSAKLRDLLDRLHPDVAAAHAQEMAVITAHLDPVRQEADRDRLIDGFVGREWLVERLEAWRLGATDSRMFWLRGAPGTGKSAFAAWITATHRCNVVALNLCSWRLAERRDPRRIIHSLAWQVARRVADYRRLLHDLLLVLGQRDANGVRELDRLEPSDLFNRLLVQPLHRAFDGGQHRERLLLVLDGLDEAVPAPGETHTTSIVEVLQALAPSLPAWVGLVVTSRPEEPMASAFAGFAALRVDAEVADNDADLRIYARGWLADGSRDPATMEPLVDAICHKAAGSFIYLRKLREFHALHPELPLDPATLPEGLRGLYRDWFRRQFPVPAAYRADVAPLLAVICAAAHPVPREILGAALGWTGHETLVALERLGGLFEARRGGWVAFHKSLQDWLTDLAGADFRVDVDAGRTRLLDALWAAWLAGPQATEDPFILAELPVQVGREPAEALAARRDTCPPGTTVADQILALGGRVETTANAARARRDRATATAWLDMAVTLFRGAGAVGDFCDASMAIDRGEIELELGSTARALSLYRYGTTLARAVLAGLPQGTTDAILEARLAEGEEAIGGVLLSQGDTAGALDAYRGGLAVREGLSEADPDSVDARRDLAWSHNRIGGVFNARGDTNAAVSAYQRGLAIIEELRAADPTSTLLAGDLAACKDNVGGQLHIRGDIDGALAAYQDALAIRQRAMQAEPDNAYWPLVVSTSHTSIGGILRLRGDSAGALQAYRAARSITERLVAADPANLQQQYNLSVDHGNVGDVLRALGDVSAVQAYNAQHDILERLIAADPSNATWHEALGSLYRNAGDLQRDLGNAAEAVHLQRSGLAIFESLVARDPDLVLARQNLAAAHERIGDLLSDGGDDTDARASYQAAVTAMTSLVERDPDNTTWQHDLVIDYRKLGDARRASGDPGAVDSYQAGRAIITSLAAAAPGNADWQSELSAMQERLGDACRQRNDLPAAMGWYRQCTEIRQQLVALDPGHAHWHRDLSIGHARIGLVLRLQGDLHGALAAVQTATTIAERVVSEHPGIPLFQLDLVDRYAQLGSLHAALGQTDAARHVLACRRKLAELLAEAAPDDAGRAYALSAAYEVDGDTLAAQGDKSGAIEAFRKAMAIRQRLTDAAPTQPQRIYGLALIKIKLGKLLSQQGEFVACLVALHAGTTALQSLIEQDPANDNWQRDLSVARLYIADTLRAQGDLAGAVACLNANRRQLRTLATANPTNDLWLHGLGHVHRRLVRLHLRRRRPLALLRAAFATGRAFAILMRHRYAHIRAQRRATS